jgi:hypothetical protein
MLVSNFQAGFATSENMSWLNSTWNVNNFWWRKVPHLIEDSGQNLFLQKTSAHAHLWKSFKGTSELRCDFQNNKICYFNCLCSYLISTILHLKRIQAFRHIRKAVKSAYYLCHVYSLSICLLFISLAPIRWIFVKFYGGYFYYNLPQKSKLV